MPPSQYALRLLVIVILGATSTVVARGSSTTPPAAPAPAAATPPAPAPAPTPPPMAPRTLAPGVVLVPGAIVPGRQPDGNSVLLLGRDGVVIVDTGRHVEHTEAVIAAAIRAGGTPTIVVNTHWHLDHIGGNVLLRQRYPDITVYASDALAAARRGFLAHYREQLAAAVARAGAPANEVAAYRSEMALIDAGDRLAPDVVVKARQEASLAGRHVVLGLERAAATAGDVWVLDEASGVLASGDLVTLPVPLLDTACPAGWLAALDRLAAVEFRLLVPGHGAPMTRAELVTYRRGFADLLVCARSSRSQEDCAAEWFATTGALDRDSDPALARSLLDYYVTSVLRGDPTRIAASCAG
jgi:glyoxylase-like metal-dependent hydrolase (beta-lactamase superfamily II)